MGVGAEPLSRLGSDLLRLRRASSTVPFHMCEQLRVPHQSANVENLMARWTQRWTLLLLLLLLLLSWL